MDFGIPMVWTEPDEKPMFQRIVMRVPILYKVQMKEKCEITHTHQLIAH